MSCPLRTTWLVAVALLVACAAAALASAPTPWFEHYQRGLTLADSGRWEEALAELNAAAVVEPRARRQIRTHGDGFIYDYDPHYHMARCYVELGRWIPAGGQLRLAARNGVTPREKLDALRRRIEVGLGVGAEARPQLPLAKPPLLFVGSVPAGAAVTVDGAAVGATPVGPLALGEGEHEVRVVAAGHAPARRIVTLRPGPPLRLELVLVPEPANPVPLAVESPTPLPQKHPGTTPTAAETHGLLPTAPQAPSAAAAPAEPPPDALTPPPTPAPRLTAPIDPARRPAASSSLLIVGALAALMTLVMLLVRRRTNVSSTPTAPTRLHEVPTLHAVPAPSLIGEFELVGTLGRGGMATTHRAKRLRDGSEVALKLPHDSCLVDDTFVARFLREGQLGEQLHHPNIVRVLQVGEHAGRPYLAMELVAGHTLKEEIRERGPLEVRRALEIARDIAEALDYAHAKGVVHRDLKPDNVMLQPSGALKVMDFGIARVAGHSGLTSTNLFLGTPLYAAPEMVDPKHVDHRIDLYALGIILFEMLQGAVPFYADSPYRVLEMHLREPLPSRANLRRPVPEAVWSVVVKLCAKDRDARYESAQTLLVELNRLLDSPLER